MFIEGIVSSYRMNTKDFRSRVYAYYNQQGRDLPWRHQPTLYRVCVSEFMLQQTQVSRVINYFRAFTQKYPSFKALHQASLTEILTAWQGLGYNRRAKYLWETAHHIAAQPSGKQYTAEELVKLPGIGRGTAGAIIAYAYDLPAVFIETNIRTVFIHHFFTNQPNVSDAAILPLIEKTIDRNNPREWYWALMDYGTYLKQQGAHNRSSAHYSKQSKFKGSLRQVRGHILSYLLNMPTPVSMPHLCTALPYPKNNIQKALNHLVQEGLMSKNNKGQYCCV
ncbi:endonuclease III [Candidatus Roizmanbacteria bacterium CG10_big_fil_rev_8_21_14_0_10_45_7]|uniref:Adenine DNA glycosylase n=1 Tax=Candidatus Roizmanbacteria bacterium CG10_big_fil_rev_8_21_14_0_10_45_7 TaxID=1974854 RepID=A0A2M8KUK6_9BACT|nr:MAG: endonuclease III [Candidatus Roizmanbacteria bacterium CG10_big_fil_rev_8_21_14_0_10_45_7]